MNRADLARALSAATGGHAWSDEHDDCLTAYERAIEVPYLMANLVELLGPQGIDVQAVLTSDDDPDAEPHERPHAKIYLPDAKAAEVVLAFAVRATGSAA